MEYRVIARVTVSLYTVVEADNKEEAKEKASERDLMTIINDSSQSEEDTWMLDEIDGEPYDFYIEE